MSNPREIFSPFLPSTYNIPEEQDRLKTFLGEKFSQIAAVVNDKKIGIMTQSTENYSGENWAYGTRGLIRTGYQSMVFIPSLPGPGTLPVPNQMIIGLTGTPLYPIPEVNNTLVVTQVWGSASRPCTSTGAGDGDYFSFYSQGDSRISFTMSDILLTITTTTDLSAYKGLIIVEYLRNGT